MKHWFILYLCISEKYASVSRKNTRYNSVALYCRLTWVEQKPQSELHLADKCLPRLPEKQKLRLLGNRDFRNRVDEAGKCLVVNIDGLLLHQLGT